MSLVLTFQGFSAAGFTAGGGGALGLLVYKFDVQGVFVCVCFLLWS